MDWHAIEIQLGQVLTEIIARLLALQAVENRLAFWHVLVHSHKVLFYLGTEQSKHLASKQVMGEWDLRTFQEIASFASKMNPNLDVRLEKPAFRQDSYTNATKKSFREFLRKRMGDAHCIVIGTPDVNPVSEMLLSELKDVEPFFDWKPSPRLKFKPGLQKEMDAFVAFKNHLYSYYEPRPTSFFVQFNDRDPLRGFLYFSGQRVCSRRHRYEQKYIPRERFESNEQRDLQSWNLLGHLLVAPNPFSRDFRVILLMGVGGPATLGLAHLLTGRLPDCQYGLWPDERQKGFFDQSESFLGKLNRLLLENDAAEAVVRIRVLNDIASTNNEYEDSREIQEIVIEDSLPGIDNPKAATVLCGRGASSPST